MNPKRAVPLADTLDVLLPGGRDALLLRACLGDKPAAAAAWDGWLAAGPALPQVLIEQPRTRRFLPLLHEALGAHAITVDPASLAILRAASLWEERRAARIREILAQALGVLRKSGIAPMLIKGVALSETVYPHRGLRHCHDIDLLVADADVHPARDALGAAGFRPAGAGQPLPLEHVDGLPLLLHTRLRTDGGGNLEDTFRRAAVTVDIAGQSVPVFAPMDMLLHVCGLGGAGAANWTWIVDAGIILRRHMPTAADWTALVVTAEKSGIALPLAVRMRGLADRIGLPIPDAVLDALADAAGRSRGDERDRALTLARSVSGQRFRLMMRRSGWRSRLDLARWAWRRYRGRMSDGSRR